MNIKYFLLKSFNLTPNPFLLILALVFSYLAEAASPPAPILARQGSQMIVPEGSPLRKRLIVSPVTQLDLPHIVALPGVVEADPASTVNILPPLTGRLMELKVGLGDLVEKGGVLAIIHSPDLDQSYADVVKAQDALKLSEKALVRARSVQETGGNAIKEVEQIFSNYEQAEAEAKRAEARLSTLVNGGKDAAEGVLTIRAPISGVVTALNIGEGAYITDPTAVMMTISNLDPIWVAANVPEDLLGSIAQGQAASVYLAAYPDKKLRGVILFVSPIVDPDTHRNKARISLSNPRGKLKPNMYGTVLVEVPQAPQAAVPPSALLMNNDSVTVFIEAAPWTFERRIVELGAEDGGNVRILSGLKGGDRVVISGGVLLND
jgi:membrane fusion protein, heavy metal efflux system